MLFNVYLDELNVRLYRASAGCHIAEKASNNLSYTDDLAILAPSVGALNELLNICDEFAMESTIKFSAAKSFVQLIKPHGVRITATPNIYLWT